MRAFRRPSLFASLICCGALCSGGIAWLAGCGGGLSPWFFLGGDPLGTGVGGGGGGGGPGNTNSGGGGGGSGGGGDRSAVDACSESEIRKGLRISMRNDSNTFIHYFVYLIAFEQTDANGDYPFGAVCPDDRDRYLQFGYQEIPAGSAQVFGNFCVRGHAYVYFHKGGQFRGAGGDSFGSAIPPAQGSSPTFDSFFDAGGATVPVPNVIIFHNAGNTAQGRALKVSRNATCGTGPGVDENNMVVTECQCGIEVNAFGADVPGKPLGINVGSGAIGDPPCSQDAWYYVDETDRLDGSTALGTDSGRRVPAEIEGTGCECLGSNLPLQQLAPSHVTAANAACNEFLRGGKIDYVFVRNDETPPFPQLLWRVTDATGSTVHEFDPRGMIP